MHSITVRLFRSVRLLTLVCISFVPATYANELVSISGNISEVSFDTLQKYYRVIADIEVPAEKSIQIPAGIILLFDSDVSFHINGQCEIKGTDLNPVVFTSVNDTQVPIATGTNPSQWDWKGVAIGKNAKVVFNNVHLKYAESPLEADSACKSIILERVFRFQTGKPEFTLSGTQLKVKSGEPFSYQSRLSEISPVAPQPVSSAKPRVSEPSSQQKQPQWYKKGVVRWTLGGTGAAAVLAAGGCIIGYYVNDSRYNREMKTYSDKTNNNFDEKRNAKEDADEAFFNRDNCETAGIVTGITAAVLLTCFSLTFYF